MLDRQDHPRAPAAAVSASVTRRLIPVERVLAGYCRASRIRFLVDGQPESAAGILAPESFLPIVTVHAEMAAHPWIAARDRGFLERVLVGAKGDLPMGSMLQADEDALFKLFAKVPALTADSASSFRLLFFVHALHKVFGHGTDRQVECAGIYERYMAGGLQRAMQTLSRSRPAGVEQWQTAYSR